MGQEISRAGAQSSLRRLTGPPTPLRGVKRGTQGPRGHTAQVFPGVPQGLLPLQSLFPLWGPRARAPGSASIRTGPPRAAAPDVAGPLVFRASVSLQPLASPQYRPGTGERASRQGSPHGLAAHVVPAQGLSGSAPAGMHLIGPVSTDPLHPRLLLAEPTPITTGIYGHPADSSLTPALPGGAGLRISVTPHSPDLVGALVGLPLLLTEPRSKNAARVRSAASASDGLGPFSDSDFLRLFDSGGCSRGALWSHLGHVPKYCKARLSWRIQRGPEHSQSATAIFTPVATPSDFSKINELPAV
ncbi:hypothetical protein NDU88_001394 [Pleurodeles waltl]|uniref:Uncharacterized protein n=1 Tax=Pleurodeles waltl TaxID=8319 RepID=A0AAV7USN4_PLEWA|nr:hypothetical protein NDU88_001394 [Pleurodeles waltl]